MSKKRTTYSPAFKTKLVLELLKNEQTLSQISSTYNVTPQNLTNWKKIFLANAEIAMEPSKAVKVYKEELAAVTEQNTQLTQIVGKMTVNPNYTLTELCSLFEIKQSTYYYQQSPRPMDNQTIQLLVNIKAIFAESDSTYGKRRIRKALQTSGFSIGIYRTASLMKKAGLKAKAPKKKHYYGDSGKVHRIAPNLLKRQFEQTTPNTHWVGDISYIRTHQGWGYLAAVLDLSSKQIVGYALSKKPNAQLAKDALSDALRKQNPNTHKLLFHSGQGVQYSAKSFVSAIRKT